MFSVNDGDSRLGGQGGMRVGWARRAGTTGVCCRGYAYKSRVPAGSSSHSRPDNRGGGLEVVKKEDVDSGWRRMDPGGIVGQTRCRRSTNPDLGHRD